MEIYKWHADTRSLLSPAHLSSQFVPIWTEKGDTFFIEPLYSQSVIKYLRIKRLTDTHWHLGYFSEAVLAQLLQNALNKPFFHVALGMLCTVKRLVSFSLSPSIPSLPLSFLVGSWSNTVLHFCWLSWNVLFHSYQRVTMVKCFLGITELERCLGSTHWSLLCTVIQEPCHFGPTVSVLHSQWGFSQTLTNACITVGPASWLPEV